LWIGGVAMAKNPFEILGMNRSLVFALRNKIKYLQDIAAYNRKWLQFVTHPDRNPGNEEAAKELNDAVRDIESSDLIEGIIEEYLTSGEIAEKEDCKDQVRDLIAKLGLLDSSLADKEKENARLLRQLDEKKVNDSLILTAFISSLPSEIAELFQLGDAQHFSFEKGKGYLVTVSTKMIGEKEPRISSFLVDGSTKKFARYKNVGPKEKETGLVYYSHEHIRKRYNEFLRERQNDFVVGSLLRPMKEKSGFITAYNLQDFLLSLMIVPFLMVGKELLIMTPRKTGGKKEVLWHRTGKVVGIEEIV
jgi:hypothetical protein